MGGPAERAHQSLAAGCDMILVCNQRAAQIEVLDNLPILDVPAAESLLKRRAFNLPQLQSTEQWKQASEAMKRLLGE